MEEKDLLQIKIDKARAQLSKDTLGAIDAVDWRAAILEMRTKRGYTLDQLADLELETELVLCGLSSPQDYPKELENRMGLSKTQRNDLVNEMNSLVFSKIKEELIKRTEQKDTPQTNQKNDTQVLGNAGIKIIKEIAPQNENVEKIAEDKGNVMKSAGIEIVPEKLELNTPKKEEHPILAQKLTGFTKSEVVKTEHTLENITKSSEIPAKPAIAPKTYPKNADPYRLPPE